MAEADLERSRAIAALAGPVLLGMASGILMNRRNFPALAEQMAGDWGLIFLSGALLLAAGVAIVRVHNVWSGGWPVVVTVLGWLSIVGGLMRMHYPRQLGAMAVSIAQTPAAVLVGAVAVLLLGLFLTLKGYRLLD